MAAIDRPLFRSPAVSAFALVALLCTSAAQAQGFRMGPSGGTGGGLFTDAPQGRVTEVRIRHGSWIDSIQIAYDNRRSSRHGGGGGRESVFTLQGGEFIKAIYGRYGRFVDSITVVTNRRSSRRFGGPGGVVDYHYEAPDGFEIAGFTGRSGVYLDSIGVVLRRR